MHNLKKQAESNSGKVTQIRLKILLAVIGSLFLFALVGLPNSPFSIIAGLRGKKESREQILIPTQRLGSALAVNNCTKELEQSAYASAADFKLVKSALTNFKSKLAKEFNTGKKSFNLLAKDVLNPEIKSFDQSKTCLLPVNISAAKSLSVDLPSSNLLAVAIGAETLYCSQSKAFLMSESGSSKFYPVAASFADYAKHIKDQNVVQQLKKQLAVLKKKLGSTKDKATKALLEQDIRRLNNSVNYSKYFSKDGLLLGSFFDSVCSQAAAIATPVAGGTVLPPSTLPPVTTKVPATRTVVVPVVTNTATNVPATNTPTVPAPPPPPSGGFKAPTVLSPVGTIIPSTNSVTIRWEVVEGAKDYMIGAVDLTNSASPVDLLFIPSHAGTSYDLSVSSGRTYRFWLKARSLENDNNFTEITNLIFSVQGNITITPVFTPTSTATPQATATSNPLCSGSSTQSCSGIANGQGTQSRICEPAGWSNWGICTVSSCNPGYTISGNGCVVGDPRAPVLLFPENNSNIAAGSLQLEWSEVDKAASYHVGITNTTDKTAEYMTFAWESTRFEFLPVANKNYSVRIIPLFRNTAGSLSWGPEGRVTFKIDAACSGGEAAQSCSVANGQGTKSRSCVSGAWTDWSPCTVLSCNSGFKISENGYSCVTTGAAPAANSCASGSATSISQYGITWYFDQAYTCGQFVNGDYWVLPKSGVNNGKIKITNIYPRTNPILTPAEINPKTGKPFDVSNGSMLNPMPNRSQGFKYVYKADVLGNEYTAPNYNARKNIALQLPYLVSQDNSVYSTKANPSPWKPCIKSIYNGQEVCSPDPTQEEAYFIETAVLTVLGSQPATDSFRPPYAGINKTIKANWKASNINFAALKNHPIPRPQNAPSVSWLEEGIKRPLIDLTNYGKENTTFKASWSRIYNTDGYPRRSYGTSVANLSGGAALMLNTNLSVEQKRKLAIYMIQWGIDTYALRNLGLNYWGQGGHQNGRLLPVFVAGKLLNDSDILAVAGAGNGFSEHAQHFFVDAGIVSIPRTVLDGKQPRPYTSAMIGMPEWSSAGGTHPKNSASWGNDSYYSSAYRFTTGGTHATTVAALLMMDGRSIINYEPFFRYSIERFYPRLRPGSSSNGNFDDGTLDTGSIPYFTRDMWDAYLTPYSPPKTYQDVN